MSNNFDKLLLEIIQHSIETKRLEEAPSNSIVTEEIENPDGESAIDNANAVKSDLGSKGTESGGILNVQDIARALITGTESEQRDQTSIKDAFDVIRKTNNFVTDLATVGEDGLVQTLINALAKYFIPPEDKGNCTDLSSMFTQHVVMSSYSMIFEEYSGSPAGFVNESFIAGLIGGVSIPSATATTIADMQIQGSKIGISLKTTASKSKLSGSFTNLMRTLGIKFRVEGGSKSYISDSDVPAHALGLYYLLFNKRSAESHTISCFKVDRGEMISNLDNYVSNQKGEKMSKEDDGTYVFRSKKDYDDLASKFAPLLGIKFDSIVDDSVVGISGFRKIEQELELNAQVTANGTQENVKKITDTLNLLNAFYSQYVNAVVSFASDPTGKKLTEIQTKLTAMSKIDPTNLVTSDNC